MLRVVGCQASDGLGLFGRSGALLFLLVVVGLAAAPVRADESASASWKEVVADSQNGIVVYSRERDEKYIEFKALTNIRTSLSALVALFLDVEHMPAWAYRTKMAMRLETISEREVMVYSVAGLDWPFRDRDLIVRTRLHQDPDTLAVTINAVSEPDYLPVDPAYVRVPYLQSAWRFVPGEEGMVEVQFSGYGDAGGALSEGIGQWLAEMVAGEGPHMTLIGMRRLVQAPRYQHQEIGFILEPSPAATTATTASPQGNMNRLSIRSASSK